MLPKAQYEIVERANGLLLRPQDELESEAAALSRPELAAGIRRILGDRRLTLENWNSLCRAANTQAEPPLLQYLRERAEKARPQFGRELPLLGRGSLRVPSAGRRRSFPSVRTRREHVSRSQRSRSLADSAAVPPFGGSPLSSPAREFPIWRRASPRLDLAPLSWGRPR